MLKINDLAYFRILNLDITDFLRLLAYKVLSNCDFTFRFLAFLIVSPEAFVSQTLQ